MLPDDPAPGTNAVVGSGPCQLSVNVTPAGSLVRVDGQVMGPSPLTIAGPCARRKIDVTHARYAPATRFATPTAGKPQSLDVVLTRPTHAVSIVSVPPGATVSIGGRRAGTTPTVVNVMGFLGIDLVFDLPGWKRFKYRLYSKTPQDRVYVRLNK